MHKKAAMDFFSSYHLLGIIRKPMSTESINPVLISFIIPDDISYPLPDKNHYPAAFLFLFVMLSSHIILQGIYRYLPVLPPAPE